MDKKNTIIIASVTIIAIMVIGFLFYQSSKSKQDITPEPEVPVLVGGEEEPEAPKQIITAKHSFDGDVHTVAGEIDLPTPCHLLETNVTVAESFPEQVVIAFDTVFEGEDTCAQVITPARFKVEFQASENARINATLNGKKVILNLIEATEGENLDDFEIFIKG